MIPKSKITSFSFVDSSEEVGVPSHARIAKIDCKVPTKLELLDAIAMALNFPGYFGRNWDAFWDCICDLSWIESHAVVMIHNDIPRFLPKFDLSMYLHTLADAVVDWKPGEAHQLIVSFPAKCRDEIEMILRSPPNEMDRPPR